MSTKRCVEVCLDEVVVVCVFAERTDRFEVPQRRVYGIVFGRLAGVGEAIGQHPAIDVLRKFEEYAFSRFGPPCHKRKSRQRDHCVAAPIAKPVIASDDSLAMFARDNVLIGGCY